jgi:hypothetical protein
MMFGGFIDCKNGHNILMCVFEARDRTDMSTFEQLGREMYRGLKRDVQAGDVPAVCPFCGVDVLLDSKFYVGEARDQAKTLDEYNAEFDADEPGNLERAKKALRRKLN